MQEFRVESNNYPAEFGTGTGGQVSVVTKSGANLFRGSLFEYYRNDKLDAPNYFDSTRNPDGSVIEELPKSKLNQHQFGGSFGGPIVEGPRVLLRQLRRLPARRRRELRRRRRRARRRGRARCRRLRRCVPASRRRARCCCRARRPTPDFDIYQLQGSRRSRRTRSASGSTTGSTSSGRRTSACSTTAASSSAPKASAAASSSVDEQADQRHLQPAGHRSAAACMNEFKVGYNAPQADISGIAPTVSGIDFSASPST